MQFPRNQIFTEKIREISRPEHLGRSSSRSCLSPANRDWPIPVPSQSRKWNGNSRIWNFRKIREKFPKFVTVQEISCWVLKYDIYIYLFSTEFQEKSWISVHFKTIQDFSWVVPSSPVPSQIFHKFFPNFPEQRDQTFSSTVPVPVIQEWSPVSSSFVSFGTKLGNADL